jgi:hypothetical protein
MSTETNRAAIIASILTIKTVDVVMPDGTTQEVSYEFGDSLDHILSAVLPTELSSKKALYGIHDETLKKLTVMEQIEANTGNLYFLGPLKSKGVTEFNEVEIMVTSEFAKKEYMFRTDYTVRYYQQLVSIVLRKASPLKPVWVHEGELVAPSSTIGEMIPLSTSEREVIAHFVTSTVYTGLGL